MEIEISDRLKAALREVLKEEFEPINTKITRISADIEKISAGLKGIAEDLQDIKSDVKTFGEQFTG